MQGNIIQCMSKGIDDSAVFVACITKSYKEKVGGSNMADNCQKEFMYAYNRQTKMLPVVMEV